MAAQFVVEDGTGLATANAYVSVAQVDQYAEDFLADSTTWTALTEAVRQFHIRTATRFLDARYRATWKGWRANELQALDWPRFGASDKSGYEIDSESLPAALVSGACQLAIESVTADLMPNQSTDGTVKKVSKTLGPISTSTEYSGSSKGVPVYRMASSVIAELLRPSGRIQRA
tara:strand:- start:530 stop:1051 length:522 start_codon:yes stop_codon:yes gene_type:complete